MIDPNTEERDLSYGQGADSAVSRITGRMISLFVHEMNNHLATLSETAGLGEDIMNAGSLSDREKLKETEKMLSRMENRIRTAASLVRAFDDFGSRLESPSGKTDVNQAINGLMPFMSKLARQKNISIRLLLSGKIHDIKGNTAGLQCLIFAVFENICASSEGNSDVTIASEESQSAITVKIAAASSRVPDTMAVPWTAAELKKLAGSLMPGLAISTDSNGTVFSIRIPK